MQFDDDEDEASAAPSTTTPTAAMAMAFNLTEMPDWNKNKDSKVQGRRCDEPGCLVFIVGTSRHNCVQH